MDDLELSRESANIIENLAYRVAAEHDGVVTPIQLTPYLPVGLGIIKDSLDRMVDGVSVVTESLNGLTVYRIANHETRPPEAAPSSKACLSCGHEVPLQHNDTLCQKCYRAFVQELRTSAEKAGWPPQAMMEHDILYHAAGGSNPIHPVAISGRSRYTLKQVRNKLREMMIEGFIDEEISPEEGSITYRFPSLTYSKEYFQRNIGILESFPASVQEEVEARVTRIFFALGFLVLILIFMAFLHVPFPLLIAAFVVSAPILSIVIWRKKEKIGAE